MLRLREIQGTLPSGNRNSFHPWQSMQFGAGGGVGAIPRLVTQKPASKWTAHGPAERHITSGLIRLVGSNVPYGPNACVVVGVQSRSLYLKPYRTQMHTRRYGGQIMQYRKDRLARSSSEALRFVAKAIRIEETSTHSFATRETIKKRTIPSNVGMGVVDLDL